MRLQIPSWNRFYFVESWLKILCLNKWTNVLTNPFMLLNQRQAKKTQLRTYQFFSLIYGQEDRLARRGQRTSFNWPVKYSVSTPKYSPYYVFLQLQYLVWNKLCQLYILINNVIYINCANYHCIKTCLVSNCQIKTLKISNIFSSTFNNIL